MPVRPVVLMNIVYSIGQFLKTYTYDGSVMGGTFLQQFPQVSLIEGYPTDLTEIKAPTLSLGVPAGISTTFDGQYYGEAGQDQVILVDLYGFVAGQGTDRNNSLYLIRLMNDVGWLFDTVARHQGIPLKDRDSASVVGSVEVDQVRIRTIPETVPAVEADRNKFICELEIAYTADNVNLAVP
jgi:hypothetical protein